VLPWLKNPEEIGHNVLHGPRVQRVCFGGDSSEYKGVYSCSFLAASNDFTKSLLRSNGAQLRI
jgi:hypothetical protein